MKVSWIETSISFNYIWTVLFPVFIAIGILDMSVEIVGFWIAFNHYPSFNGIDLEFGSCKKTSISIEQLAVSPS